MRKKKRSNDSAIKDAFRRSQRERRNAALSVQGKVMPAHDEGRVDGGRVLPAIDDEKEDR